MKTVVCTRSSANDRAMVTTGCGHSSESADTRPNHQYAPDGAESHSKKEICVIPVEPINYRK